MGCGWTLGERVGRERHCRRQAEGPGGSMPCLVLFVIVAVECRRMATSVLFW
jgi:hypothetical protein